MSRLGDSSAGSGPAAEPGEGSAGGGGAEVYAPPEHRAADGSLLPGRAATRTSVVFSLAALCVAMLAGGLSPEAARALAALAAPAAVTAAAEGDGAQEEASAAAARAAALEALLACLPMDTPAFLLARLRACLARDRAARPSSSDLAASLRLAAQYLASGAFDVFLSHSWVPRDKETPKSLAPATRELYRTLVAAGRRVWLDVHEMGQDMEQSMLQGVQRSACVVAVMTQRYAGSSACAKELRFAAQAGKRVVAVLAEADLAWRPPPALGLGGLKTPDLRPFAVAKERARGAAEAGGAREAAAAAVSAALVWDDALPELLRQVEEVLACSAAEAAAAAAGDTYVPPPEWARSADPRLDLGEPLGGLPGGALGRIEGPLAAWRAAHPARTWANVHGREDLRDEDLVHLRGCTAVNLRGCTGITSRGLRELRGVRVLYMCHCTQDPTKCVPCARPRCFPRARCPPPLFPRPSPHLTRGTHALLHATRPSAQGTWAIADFCALRPPLDDLFMYSCSPAALAAAVAAGLSFAKREC